MAIEQFNDITEKFNYALTNDTLEKSYDPTTNAYDISIGGVPFVISASNQNPYVRQTGQYRKDQFDAAPEPGEQSLVGWWLRSQTSWHHGAGIRYFEPGLDSVHVTHKFYDSRGVDVWNIGYAQLHNQVFYGYTGASGIKACEANDGTNDCLVSGDTTGAIKKIVLASTDDTMATATTLFSAASHGSYAVNSVASDGSYYYASCTRCIHKGSVDGTVADSIIYKFSTTDKSYSFMEYSKGYVFHANSNVLWIIDPNHTSSASHTTGAVDLDSNSTIGGSGNNVSKTHANAKWIWNGVTAGPAEIYAIGYAGGKSEIWSIGFDQTTNLPDAAGASVVVELPFGEIAKTIKYYMGYVIIGTTKGVRIASIDSYRQILTLGPLLFDSNYAVNDISVKDKFAYVATKADVKNSAYKNAVLIRIDMSVKFDDGTFPYAYDLEYESAAYATPSNSEATYVFNLNDRMVMVLEEDGTGEIQVEHKTKKRTTGWIETGYIRYATVEPKFFKYIKTTGSISDSDYITLTSIDGAADEFNLISLNSNSFNKDVAIAQPAGKQEVMAFRYDFYNSNPVTTGPRLDSYQVKSIPAASRQRLIQYPLSCFDMEMDRYNVEFGYIGRAYDTVVAFEQLEENGDFVTVKDYRTGEIYTGIVDDVRYRNESSSDKINSGYGGILLVTIRKV